MNISAACLRGTRSLTHTAILDCWQDEPVACRPALIMRGSHIKMDGGRPEAQMVTCHWKQQRGIAVALDGGCLLEIQPSEELDEDCQLIPQACVSLSSSLNPISDAKMEGSLRGKLFRIAGRQLENFGPVLSR